MRLGFASLSGVYQCAHSITASSTIYNASRIRMRTTDTGLSRTDRPPEFTSIQSAPVSYGTAFKNRLVKTHFDSCVELRIFILHFQSAISWSLSALQVRSPRP